MISIPRTHSRKPAPAPEGILLGWRQPPKPTTGFGKSKPPARKPYEPITYTGDGHLLTIAPTGAGKGISAAIPAWLTYPGPIIGLDVKGEQYQVAARCRREMGHVVVGLDPFHWVSPKSDGLNVLDLLYLPGSMVDVDSEMLAAALAVGHKFGTDPYWTDSANGLLAGLIAHVATTAPPEQRNLNEVRRRMCVPDFDYDIAVELDKGAVTNRLAREKFTAYLTAPSDKTRPCILSTAMSHVDMFGSDAVAEMLQRTTFDLQALVDGRPLDVFLIIPPDRLESHAPLLRICLSTMLTAIVRRREIPRQRTLLLVDEAGQLGNLDALRQAITLFRGSGLTVWTFWQDASQLRRNFERDWETIINNCGVIQSFSATTHLMATAISNLIDRPSHELLNLPADQQALFIHGQGAQIARKLNYLRDPGFAGLFDANPRYAQIGEQFMR